jgi:hypothetical protein
LRKGGWEWGAYPSLVRVRDGFVFSEACRLMYGTTEPRWPLRDVTPSGLRLGVATGSIQRLAAEPGTGRLAAWINRWSEPDDLVVLGADLTVIASTGIPDAVHGRQICFSGPSVLTIYGQGPMASWHVGSSAISPIVADTPAWANDVQSVPGGPMRIVCHNALGWVAEYLDPGTLRPVACPDALAWASALDGTLYPSPDGRYAAFWPRGRDELEVRDLRQQEISELVSRPLARFRPADFPAVAELAGRLPDQGAIGLLQLCLEYRFGSDVAIGDAPSSVPGMDDIGLTRG